MMVDTALFQTKGDSDPVRRRVSGDLGKPRGPVVPNSEVVTKRKVNPKTRKKKTNFFLEMFISTLILARLTSHSRIKTFLNIPSLKESQNDWISSSSAAKSFTLSKPSSVVGGCSWSALFIRSRTGRGTTRDRFWLR